MLHIRPIEPRKGVRDPYYAPERDIAQLGPHLIRIAMSLLDEQEHEVWFRVFLQYFDITQEELGDGAKRLASAVTDMSLNTPAALEKSGFSSLPSPVQAALYICMGRVLLPAIHSAIRDITAQHDAPPSDVQQLTESAEEAVKQIVMPKIIRRCQRAIRWSREIFSSKNQQEDKTPPFAAPSRNGDQWIEEPETSEEQE